MEGYGTYLKLQSSLREVLDELKTKKILPDRQAEDSFNGYIARLANTIGEDVKSIVIVGDLWNYSVISVERRNGEIERWRTQMVINTESLFPQLEFPTRKLK